MKEYTQLIKKYSSGKYSLYSKSGREEKWGNKTIAEEYLKKYFIPKNEYNNIWKPIQSEIFSAESPPSMVFSNGFNALALRGGFLFTRKNYEALQNCLLSINEKYIVVIQNDFHGLISPPLFRMKYPISTTWEELMSGNFISTALFEMFHNDYYVFGENAVWGKYSANDDENPLDIIGFKPNVSNIFIKEFMVSDEEWCILKEWLPEKYLNEYNNLTRKL